MRQSTSKLYQYRWNIFRNWCLQHGLSAVRTPVNSLAEFFIFLRDTKGLSLSAIKGYRSTIASIQPDVGTNLDLSTLMKSFAVERPPPVRNGPVVH